MSIESAKAFVDKMKNDEDFRKKVNGCKDVNERKDFVIKEGFEFSLQELKECTGELSDDELNNIGGSGCYKEWLHCKDVCSTEACGLMQLHKI